LAPESFPLCVSPDHVMGLLGYLSGLGGVADAGTFNRASGVDLDLLPHALRAAEMLGLVEVDSGYIMLSRLGKGLSNETARHARKALGEILVNVEPFGGILRALRDRRILRREEAMELMRGYHYWEGDDDAERGFRCLLSWLLYAHLADYDPEEEVLKLPRERRVRSGTS